MTDELEPPASLDVHDVDALRAALVAETFSIDQLTAALWSAAEYRRLDAAVALLAAGANPNDMRADIDDDMPRRTVAAALVWGAVDVAQDGRGAQVDALVRALLAAGADPNERDAPDGRTMLMDACNYLCTDAVRTLLAAGADATLVARKETGRRMGVRDR